MPVLTNVMLARQFPIMTCLRPTVVHPFLLFMPTRASGDNLCLTQTLTLKIIRTELLVDRKQLKYVTYIHSKLGYSHIRVHDRTFKVSLKYGRVSYTPSSHAYKT